MSVHLHPVPMLYFGTHGSRVVFAASHESLKTENLKVVLWVSGCKVIESFRLEETSKIIESSH